MMRVRLTSLVTTFVSASFFASAPPAVAQVTPDGYGANDFTGAGTALNILPPGQKGVHNIAEQATIATVCTPVQDPDTCSRNPNDYPEYTIDQLLMYDELLQAAPTLTKNQLPDYFKDAHFGVPPHKILRQYNPGGRTDVVVVRDSDYGVPRIYAADRNAASYAAGYVSAEDRLFLMDILRHVGRGRMSEFLGPSPSNLGMDRDAYRSAGYDEAELQSMVDHLVTEDPIYGPITKQNFQDFSDGVNQYLLEALADPTKLPAEYVTLQEDPALWKPTDTVAVASLIGATFGVGGGGELNNCRFLDRLETQFGAGAAARAVFEDFQQDDDPEKPSTTDNSFPYLVQGPIAPEAVACPDSATMTAAVQGATFIGGESVDGPFGAIPIKLDSRASNALLVGPSRSESGYPLAVFGPQTGYFSPQILMEIEAHAPTTAAGPGIDSRGAAFPGISLLVLLGRGQDHAWSATSAGSDLVDIVAAPLCEPGGLPATMDSRHFLYNGQCLPMYERTDIWIAKPGAAGIPEDPPGIPEGIQQPPDLPSLIDDPLFTFGAPDPLTGNVVVTAKVLRTAHGIVQSFANVRINEGTLQETTIPVAYVRQRSTFFHEVDSAAPFIKMNSPDLVQNAADFKEALGGLNFTFNWFYADAHAIAYQGSGHHPIRAVDGLGRSVDHDLPYFATGEWDWQNWNPTTWTSDRLPAAQVPNDENPAKGYLTSWNNAQAPGWNSADANLGYGPIHRSVPLDDRILSDSSITITELVQAMEDAGTVDLRADKVVPLVAQVIGATPTGNSNVDLGLQVLNDWSAAGGHRRDLDKDGDYDHAAAVELMDRWWRNLVDAVFAPLGSDARNAMPLGLHNAPGPVGSAFLQGRYGIVHKDLRGALAGTPVAPFSRVYCGDGVLATCRSDLMASLDSAVQGMINDFGPSPANWDADEVGDRVQFSAGGTAAVPDMDWINRPTFQQVVEFQLDAQAVADIDADGVPDSSDNCVYAANALQADADGDGLGDECECGDTNLDGFVNDADADLLRASLQGIATLPTDSHCDTNHDLDCTNADATRIRAFEDNALTKPDLVCVYKVAP